MSSRSSKQCAYCGAKGKLTKEHIIADFLYRESPDQKLGYNQRANRFMNWEATVKDVCEACNNGPLSELDSYASAFLKSIDYKRTYSSATKLNFRYDFDKLLRWLLKVSFNASRGFSDAPPLLRATIPYILGKGEPPPTAFLAVEVLQDTPLSESEKQYLPPEARNWQYIPTKMFRVGQGVLPQSSGDQGDLPYHILRFVAINSWHFMFCLVPSSVGRPSRRRLSRLFQEMLNHTVLLKAGTNQTKISVSSRTGIEAYQIQGLRVADPWSKYLADS